MVKRGQTLIVRRVLMAFQEQSVHSCPWAPDQAYHYHAISGGRDRKNQPSALILVGGLFLLQFCLK